MCTIAKKSYTKNVKEDSEGYDSNSSSSEEELTEEQKDLIQDAQDVALLQAKAYGDILLMWSYIFEYFATIEEIQAIFVNVQDKSAKKSKSDDSETDESETDNESEEDESEKGLNGELGREYYISLNSDATAVSAATIGLYGQTILTNIAGIRYSRYLEHLRNRKLAVVKSANDELYISAVLEEAAYLFELVGAQKIYNIKISDPYLDTE